MKGRKKKSCQGEVHFSLTHKTIESRFYVIFSFNEKKSLTNGKSQLRATKTLSLFSLFIVLRLFVLCLENGKKVAREKEKLTNGILMKMRKQTSEKILINYSS
jgi:hypothetical protein